MNNNKLYEGLTREEVAFQLDNKFHASYASRKLRQYGEHIDEHNGEVLHNPKAPLDKYLMYSPYSDVWFTLDDLHGVTTVFPIGDLVHFLEHLGLNNDNFKKNLAEIDAIQREIENKIYYRRKR